VTAAEYLAAFLADPSREVLGELAASPPFRLTLYQALGAPRVPLRQYQPLLRDLFERELRYRLSDDYDLDDGAHFENIYLCGLLLYELGSLDDLELLCRAKFCRDMDLGMGFDIQSVVGAGVEATMDHLAQITDDWAAKALSYLRRCKDAGDLDWLGEWHAAKRAYFGLAKSEP